jgi:hypothetical protein
MPRDRLTGIVFIPTVPAIANFRESRNDNEAKRSCFAQLSVKSFVVSLMR